LKETIRQLRQNLEAALERAKDAEEGALALLDENAKIYQQAKNITAKIAMLQRDLDKSKRGAVIGYAVGGISFGIGSPLIISGIYNKNSAMVWAGAGTITGTGAIWAIGHFVFKWW
jgi:hypothetical protein